MPEPWSPSRALRIDAACLRFERAWNNAGEAGGRPRVEDYLAGVPEADRRALLGELVVLDCTYRRQAGDRPRLEDYLGRFPGEEPVLAAALAEADPDHTGPEAPRPMSAEGSLPLTAPAEEAPAVPGYEVLRELGKGGMGVVYLARQVALKRLVALKVIRGDARAGPESRERFRAEAEAVARLKHPNIVQIYEVGERGGRPFFSLEHVEGGSLARRLAGTPLPAFQAARLVELLARAVHAAHQRGIVHRDLKPANVLLAPSDRFTALLLGGPGDGLFEPKVADFGLAKQLDEAEGHTEAGAILGTPSYMAPEQADGLAREVGPGADVYALGAILYECLTGRPPFKGATALETLEQVRRHEPVPPRRLQPRVPIDLETVCLKCLEKLPARRYVSALDLAEDLRRFQADEPIRARPADLPARALKWVKRRPAAAGLLAVTLASLLALGGYYLDAAQRRDELVSQTEHRRREQFAHQLTLAASLHERDPDGALDLLEDSRTCPPELRDFAWGYLHRLCSRRRRVFRGFSPPLAFSPDGRSLALLRRRTSAPQQVVLWDLHSGRERTTLPLPPGCVAHALAFTPDGRTLAVAGVRSNLQRRTGVSRVRVAMLFDVATGLERLSRQRPATGDLHAVFTADATAMLISRYEVKADRKSASRVVTLWDVTTGGQRDLHRDRHRESGTSLFASMSVPLALSPDGKTLALVGMKVEGPGGASLPEFSIGRWEVTGEPARLRHTLAGKLGNIHSIAFSAGGTALAVGRSDGVVKVYDVAAGQERASFRRTLPVHHLAFAPDGRALAASGNGAMTLWNLSGQKEVTTFRRFGVLRAPVFAPEGQTLAADGPGGVQLRDVAPSHKQSAVEGYSAEFRSLTFAPDGRTLAGASDRHGEVRLWDASSGRLRQTLVLGKPRQDPPLRVLRSFFAPDSRLLVTVVEQMIGRDSVHRSVRLWDVRTGRERAALAPDEGPLTPVGFTPDGKALVSGDPGGNVRLWDVETLHPQAGFKVPGTIAQAAVGGGLVATAEDLSGGKGGRFVVRLSDVGTGQERGTLKGAMVPLVFDPAGRFLACTGRKRRVSQKGAASRWDGSLVRVWDVAAGRERASLRATTPLLFSPDGSVLACRSQRSQFVGVTLWDVLSGRKRAELAGTVLAFSTDGRTLATAAAGGPGGWGAVVLWDTATGQRRATLQGHNGTVVALGFADGGRTLCSAGTDGAVRLWEADAWQGGEPGQPGTAEEDGSVLPDVLKAIGVVVVAVAAFWVVLCVAAFTEVLGLALAGRWLGWRVTSFGVGLGYPLCLWEWGGTRVYLGRRLLFWGACFCFSPQIHPPPRRVVPLLLAGFAGNALLAGLALGLWWLLPWGGPLWLLVAGVNGLVVLVSLLPLSALGTRMAHVREVLRDGLLTPPIRRRLLYVNVLRDLGGGFVDAPGYHVSLLEAAGAWLELGDVEQAEGLCAEAALLPVEHSPLAAGMAALTRGRVTREAGRLAASALALDEAERLFAGMSHEVGLFLVAHQRAELLSRRGEHAAARASLEGLLGHPVALSRPGLGADLLASLACVHLARPANEGTDPQAAYERARRGHPSASRDLRVYTAAGWYHARREEWPQAEEAYRKALDAARRISRGLSDGSERTRFRHAQADLLAEARACLGRAGKAEEAEKLGAAFGPPGAADRPRASTRLSNPRLHAASYLLALANAAVAVRLAWTNGVLERWHHAVRAGLPLREMLALAWEDKTSVDFLALSLIAGFYVIALSTIPLALVAPRVPLLRRTGALLTLLVALLPWLVWLANRAWE
jgi:WD40 repeat protein/predicted Ser/Thr protein kinase